VNPREELAAKILVELLHSLGKATWDLGTQEETQKALATASVGMADALIAELDK
jgi:hypothetical protein